MNTATLVRTTSNVVLNDTASQKQAPASANPTPLSILYNFEEKRKTWEEGAFRTSNQALYEILAECLAYAGELTTEQAKARSKALEAFFKERGYVWKADAPLITKIVRAVFGAVDRRRISTYSLVLRQARLENVSALAFAEWVESKGGLQEIRLQQSATFVSPSRKSEIVKQRFEDMPELANIKSEMLSLQADADKAGTECVLIAEQQSDGSFSIRSVVRSSAAVNAAFAAMYSGLNVVANVTAANDTKITQAA